MNNIYWPVFKNIETEINTLMFNIHFDDKQLDVYSSKISDLILRASTEIESLSKELYHLNGGTAKKNLKYDYDCLKFLNQQWKLEHKQVILSSYNCFISNKIIEPFKKNVTSTFNHKQTYGWNNAYQNLKHDRSKSLEFGSVRYLIEVTAALYVLNLYFKDDIFNLGHNMIGNNFDAGLGSSIFSVKLHAVTNQQSFTSYLKNDDFEECIYILKSTDDTSKVVHEALTGFKELETQIILQKTLSILPTLGLNESITDEDGNKLIEAINKIKGDAIMEVANTHGKTIVEAFKQVQYEAVLNKNQF